MHAVVSSLSLSHVPSLCSAADDQKRSDKPREDVAAILGSVHSLVESVNQKLSFSKTQEVDLPPALELAEPLTDSPDDPALVQFMDLLAWDVINSDPDPGQAVALRKYIPVDLLQVSCYACNA
jgi:hypothetical protein